MLFYTKPTRKRQPNNFWFIGPDAEDFRDSSEWDDGNGGGLKTVIEQLFSSWKSKSPDAVHVSKTEKTGNTTDVTDESPMTSAASHAVLRAESQATKNALKKQQEMQQVATTKRLIAVRKRYGTKKSVIESTVIVQMEETETSCASDEELDILEDPSLSQFACNMEVIPPTPPPSRLSGIESNSMLHTRTYGKNTLMNPTRPNQLFLKTSTPLTSGCLAVHPSPSKASIQVDVTSHGGTSKSKQPPPSLNFAQNQKEALVLKNLNASKGTSDITRTTKVDGERAIKNATKNVPIRKESMGPDISKQPPPLLNSVQMRKAARVPNNWISSEGTSDITETAEVDGEGAMTNETENVPIREESMGTDILKQPPASLNFVHMRETARVLNKRNSSEGTSDINETAKVDGESDMTNAKQNVPIRGESMDTNNSKQLLTSLPSVQATNEVHGYIPEATKVSGESAKSRATKNIAIRTVPRGINKSKKPPQSLPSVKTTKAVRVSRCIGNAEETTEVLENSSLCDLGNDLEVLLPTQPPSRFVKNYSNVTMPTRTYGKNKSKEPTKTNQLLSNISTPTTSGCFVVHPSPSKSPISVDVTSQEGTNQSKQLPPSLNFVQTTSKSPFKITVTEHINLEGVKQQLFGPSLADNVIVDKPPHNNISTITTALSSMSQQPSNCVSQRVLQDKCKVSKTKKRSIQEYFIAPTEK